jgi:nucleotide-binding universal stress UspA family protein
VMGTHGRSRARRFFLGSVAQEVVQAADRPVLVVPGNVPARGAWRR